MTTAIGHETDINSERAHRMHPEIIARSGSPMPDKIYVLTNEAMPGIVKIGFTAQDDVEARLTQLSSHAGVPLPFECYFAAEVQIGDGLRIEKTLHQLFGEYRVNPKREFFRVD